MDIMIKSLPQMKSCGLSLLNFIKIRALIISTHLILYLYHRKNFCIKVRSLNSSIKSNKPLCIIFMKGWDMAQKFLHWEILKDWRHINIATIFSNLKIRLVLHSSMYYFFPKKSNCNYQGKRAFHLFFFQVELYFLHGCFIFSAWSSSSSSCFQKVENQRMNIMKGMKLECACKYIVVHMLLNPTITMITIVVISFCWDDVSPYQIMFTCIWIHGMLL